MGQIVHRSATKTEAIRSPRSPFLCSMPISMASLAQTPERTYENVGVREQRRNESRFDHLNIYVNGPPTVRKMRYRNCSEVAENVTLR